MRRRWSKFVAMAGIAVAVSLGIAVPAGAEGEPETGGFNSFVLKASNGYTMRVLAFSENRYRNGEVLILTSRKGRGVGYFAPATVTDTRIDADLGELGRIELEFQPNGRQKSAPGCEPGDRSKFESGVYVGTLDFRGEEGYTRVSTTRVPFSPQLLIDLVCGVSGEGEFVGRDIPGARLRARAGRGREEVSVQVNQNRPGARVRVEAAIEERRGPIFIAREVELFYPATAFDFDPTLRSASVRPPAPFSGSAVFRRYAKPPNRWTGSLTVDFPGNSNIALAGGRFRATLVPARLGREVFRSDRPADAKKALEDATSLPPKT